MRDGVCSRRAPLLEGSVGECPLFHCGSCFGLWLDTGTFERLCHDTEQQSAVLGMPGVIAEIPPQALTAVRYVKCPRCAPLMNRVNFAHCSGVVIDVCRAHGSWFDRDELHRVVEFIRSGGLTQARAAETASLEEQRRRLEAERRAGPYLLSEPPPADDLLSIVLNTAGWIHREWERSGRGRG